MPEPFAHEFFTNAPRADRTPNGNGQTGMSEIVKDALQTVPVLVDDPVWTLADVVGTARAQAITDSGSICFHAVGDTGNGKYPVQKSGDMVFGQVSTIALEGQTAVARAMNADINPSASGRSAAFFLHLGDVIYFDNTPTGYHEQFYVPYRDYGGKIIAIPGNHDGELLMGHQPSTLYEFQKNFCPPTAVVPPDAAPVVREMSAQPGVFWWLQAPFVDVIGLYSNIAEGPGHIKGGAAGTAQYDWFGTALQRIAANRDHGQRKALVIAVHHPPFTAEMFGDHNGGHKPSTEMMGDMDAAFTANGLWPDAVLSAHAHNFQHFTRYVQQGAVTKEIPYLIAGGGGRQPQKVIQGANQQQGDIEFIASHTGHGYLMVTASSQTLQIDYHPVPGPDPLHEAHIVVTLA